MAQLSLWFGSFVLLLALEAPLLRGVERWWLTPDVVVLAAVYLGSRAPLLPALLICAAVGLVKDGLCLAAPLGMFVEIGAIGVLTTRLLSRGVDLRSPLPTMATTGLGTFLAVGMFLVFSLIFHRAFAAAGEVLRAAPAMALGTMLVTVPVFAALDRAAAAVASRERLRGGTRLR